MTILTDEQASVVPIDRTNQTYRVRGRNGGWFSVQVHKSLPATCSCIEHLKLKGTTSLTDCYHIKKALIYIQGGDPDAA